MYCRIVLEFYVTYFVQNACFVWFLVLHVNSAAVWNVMCALSCWVAYDMTGFVSFCHLGSYVGCNSWCNG